MRLCLATRRSKAEPTRGATLLDQSGKEVVQDRCLSASPKRTSRMRLLPVIPFPRARVISVKSELGGPARWTHRAYRFLRISRRVEKWKRCLLSIKLPSLSFRKTKGEEDNIKERTPSFPCLREGRMKGCEIKKILFHHLQYIKKINPVSIARCGKLTKTTASLKK